MTAATLYEAVALGLAAIPGNEWVAGIAQGLNVVKVCVADMRVEREVRLMDFTKWLDRKGGSPRKERFVTRFGRSSECHRSVESFLHSFPERSVRARDAVSKRSGDSG